MNAPRPPRSALPPLRQRLAAWREQHAYGFLSSLGRLLQRPWATLLTAGVMGLALALPLCLLLLLGNLERISGPLDDAKQLSVFLMPDVTEVAADEAREQVERMPGVESVLVQSPEAGLAEFRQMADFAGALAVLDYNPLPTVLVVMPRVGVDEAALAETLRHLPQADFVQHDAEWRVRLAAWLAFGRRVTGVAAVLMGLGALLVVGNTVRLDIQGRAEEIQTVQLLGATDGFVRRPFLYLGAWYGALAALVALAAGAATVAALQAPVSILVDSYGAQFALRGVEPVIVAGVLAVGIAVGWSGAFLAATYQLRSHAMRGEA